VAEHIDKAEALSRFSFYNGDRIPERDVDGFQNTITFHDAKAVIRSIRPADVRPVVRGRWVKIYEDGEPAVAQHQVGVCCSKCMKMPDDKFTESDFCPRRGADMKGEIGGEE
jgi:hypothetical protein